MGTASNQDDVSRRLGINIDVARAPIPQIS
jgi:hypothetical protein